MTLKKPKAKKVRDDGFKPMLRAVAKYIEAHGGMALVLGDIGVSHRPPAKYNWTLHINFTGKPPKP